jgi:hypothetical protein
VETSGGQGSATGNGQALQRFASRTVVTLGGFPETAAMVDKAIQFESGEAFVWSNR